MMKKRFFALLTAILLLVSLCACTNQPEEKDPSVPSTNVQPTDPTPTNPVPNGGNTTNASGPYHNGDAYSVDPPETEPPYVQPTYRNADFFSISYMEAAGFQAVDGSKTDSQRLWVYTGTDDHIPLDHCGLNITIPPEWSGKVSIYLVQNAHSDYFFLYICNTALMNAYSDVSSLDIFSDFWRDAIVSIFCEPNTSIMDCEPVEGIYHLAAFNDPYYFLYSTREMGQKDTDGNFTCASDLIHNHIGQEAYDEMANALVCTPEMIPDLLSFTEPALTDPQR